jgi:hypothetical protein
MKHEFSRKEEGNNNSLYNERYVLISYIEVAHSRYISIL